MYSYLGLSRLILSYQVVVLDEPSAGIDPLARRAIWSLIQARQPFTTTLITTHYLDEADLLADHIALLHQVWTLVGYSVALRNPPKLGLESRVDSVFRLSICMKFRETSNK